METINTLEDLNNFLSKQDNSENVVYCSNVPEICKEEPCILGVDEAGRGPVLGPMVYGVAYCPLAKSSLLSDLGCADSKALTEEKREEIFSNYSNHSECFGWAIDIISPNFICNNMLARSKNSLNKISMDSAIGLIKKTIDSGINIVEIYVDTVGPPEKYEAYLKRIFVDIKITVAKKADSTYPIVSAASICAKVSRDHALHMWNFKEGLEITCKEFGSGYPNDPETKKFLQEHSDLVFGYSQLVRFSWSTSAKLLEDNAYQVDWSDEDEKKNPKVQSINKFFSKQNGNVKKKHSFFVDRHLTNTDSL